MTSLIIPGFAILFPDSAIRQKEKNVHLHSQMKQEGAYLQQHDRARMALKAIVDMPDHYADRIIRSMLDNKGQLSQKLKKEYEFLASEGVWEEMVAAVQAVFG